MNEIHAVKYESVAAYLDPSNWDSICCVKRVKTLCKTFVKFLGFDSGLIAWSDFTACITPCKLSRVQFGSEGVRTSRKVTSPIMRITLRTSVSRNYREIYYSEGRLFWLTGKAKKESSLIIVKNRGLIREKWRTWTIYATDAPCRQHRFITTNGDQLLQNFWGFIVIMNCWISKISCVRFSFPIYKWQPRAHAPQPVNSLPQIIVSYVLWTTLTHSNETSPQISENELH